ncbi:putative quinol monooxygenase [Aneurinibacillus sp. Ricciae_BoGa-3]|uniref:putative quinol monooxygenase n=1 Tax=Aneurinibacillus sp. Ricciae_BoGa-3 TaxID=3022697 RepID=UPI002340181C|nr:putative quinol monooxygenase [Aneurinibacillus sp. Ricciae_BoGa-3]WCK54871.1 putative quinol monooxygenase [Aneurinibacillus sp. Ricciae_BoGa-3]
MKPIIITAILKPKEGFQDQLLSELKKVQLASREEIGCIEYNLNQSVEDDTFVLYEVWKDNEALDRHAGSSHYQEYRNNIKDFVSTREVYKMKTIN